jgi:hypothetical protein
MFLISTNITPGKIIVLAVVVVVIAAAGFFWMRSRKPAA